MQVQASARFTDEQTKVLEGVHHASRAGPSWVVKSPRPRISGLHPCPSHWMMLGIRNERNWHTAATLLCSDSTERSQTPAAYHVHTWQEVADSLYVLLPLLRLHLPCPISSQGLVGDQSQQPEPQPALRAGTCIHRVLLLCLLVLAFIHPHLHFSQLLVWMLEDRGPSEAALGREAAGSLAHGGPSCFLLHPPLPKLSPCSFLQTLN